MLERWLLTALPVFVCAAMFNGCASKNDRGLELREVTLEEFAGAPVSATTAPSPTTLSAAAVPTTATDEAATGPATAPATQPVVPLVATGSAAPRRPLKVGEPVVVDSVIGQVAGRPLFANKFLDTTTLSERFRAEAPKMDSRQFADYAAQAIFTPLQQEVLNDLFLAEAQASLTPEQKMGLLAFMQKLREDVIGRGRGSELFTQSELAEKGMTLDQYLELERDRTLISSLIQEKISSRVVVSWADVERAYQRRYAEFNPPATVTLARLRLPAQPPEQAQRVTELIRAGTTFDEIAQEFPSAQVRVLDPEAMGPGGISDIQINPEYKPKLAGLNVGQTTEPIAAGENIVWLHVQAIDRPPGKSLYDVQRLLIGQLREQRFIEERARYIKTLFEKGIFTALPEMSQRVLTVVLMRYSP